MAICGKCKAEGVSVDHVRQCYEVTDSRPIGHDEDAEISEFVEKLREAFPAKGRVDVFVPFAEKDEAKKFGAKWDRKGKTWYLPEGVPDGFPERFLEAQESKILAPAEPGFYKKDGELYKVVLAVHGSGLPYAKRFVSEDDVLGWVVAQGMARRLGEEDKASLEDAKEFGHLYGQCMACGRTLTDENSIAAGIGPICAGKF